MPQKKREIINGKIKCSKCGYMLPVAEFGKTTHTSSGLRSCCKVCEKANYWSKRPMKNKQSAIIGRWESVCVYCNKGFMSKSPKACYCSDKCRKRDWYEKNERTKS